MVKTVTSYETTDGELFSDEAEAKKHQAEVDVINWYENNALNAWDHAHLSIPCVSTKEMLDYLKKHKHALKGMLERL